MKHQTYNWIIPVLITLLFIACSKENSVSEREYLSEVQGTYEGSLSINNKNTTPATAEVSLTNNDQLEIHCFGEMLDTTIVMEAYENGDSIMLCTTGNDFEHEYGHMGGNYHMMDMMDSESEWEHHMNTDHQEGDEHYGGFNMMNGSFEYTFKKMHNDTIQKLVFSGVHR